MKDKNFFYSTIVLVTLIVIFLILVITKPNKEVKVDSSYKNDIEIKETKNEEVKEEDNTKETIKEDNKITKNTKKDTKVNKEEDTTINENKYEEVTEAKSEQVYSSNDIKVIDEINNINEKVKNVTKNEKTKNALKICKGAFITYVDFIFFDGEINGVKFDELTENGKEKVLSLVSKIDEYIESRYPNYKDDISSTTKDAFNRASILIKNGAKKINEFSKSKLSEENYNSIIEAKDDLVTFTKSASEVVKNVSSNIYNKTKSKLYDWYINFKSKN